MITPFGQSTKQECPKISGYLNLAYSQLSRNANFLQNRIRKWSLEAKQLLTSETNRVSELVEERNKKYHALTLPLLEDLDNQRLSINQVLDQLDAEKDRQDKDNAELFESYISTLRSMEESVNLDVLVNVTMAENEEAQRQIERLNSLAQLGITVEVIGHEIEGFEMTISRGLREMPDSVKSERSYLAIKTAYQGLSDKLRFLSPLKLSGEKNNLWITGEDIFTYVHKFLDRLLEDQKITFERSDAFAKFKVYEQPARIYPVFINLVNNAAYWVGQSGQSVRKVLLDVSDNRIVIADNGPGVDKDDVAQLFSLFFTRKIRGGRGVGLYLCRANLAAGGHKISYVTDFPQRKLPGANFVIDFNGAQYE